MLGGVCWVTVWVRIRSFSVRSGTWASGHPSWHPLHLLYDFCLPSESPLKAENSKKCGAREWGRGPSEDREVPGSPSLTSLVVSTGVRAQCLPRGPSHQADARDGSCEEPHVLLTWMRIVTRQFPT